MPRTKIECKMSANELREFYKTLADTPNLTLKRLQELAAKRGISISLMGAKRFKDGAFAAHLEHLRKARELAEQIAEFGNIDSGSLADAGAAILMQQVYDEITNGEKIDFDTFSKIISRLRSGDHRQRELSAKLKLLEAQIAENERREAERKAAKEKTLNDLKKGGGLSEEALLKIEQHLSQL